MDTRRKHLEMRSSPLRSIGAELRRTIPFEVACPADGVRTTLFLLRSLPRKLVEIPGRFSSSLPPPSFVRGRSAAIFLTADVALCGIGPFVGASCAA